MPHVAQAVKSAFARAGMPPPCGTRPVAISPMFPAMANKEVGIDFTINGKPYDHHDVSTAVKLGTAEAWTILGHTQMGSEGHPFHIHVNKFEVKTIGKHVQPPGVILDTVWVSPSTNVETWMKFVQWTGKTVFHCHILPHEDTGMMKNLLIQG